MSNVPIRLLSVLMLCSGCTALTLEMVWLRRLSLHLGSAGLSATVTLAIYMGGLGFGSWMASKIPLDTSSKVVWIFGTLCRSLGHGFSSAAVCFNTNNNW